MQEVGKRLNPLDQVRGRPVLFGKNKASVADTNKETPQRAKPLYRLPILSPINPTAYGPAKPPRFATELIKAMPDAAANPVRNPLGRE